MTHVKSSRSGDNNNLSYQLKYSSLKKLSQILACIGCLVWTKYNGDGLRRYISQSKKEKTKTAQLRLVYGTYFCKPNGDFIQSNILLFCILQLLICIGLAVGVTKIHKILLWFCWTFMCGLLLIRLYRFFLTDCPWGFRVTFHLTYATVEIWIILIFIVEIQRKTRSCRDNSRTMETQLYLQVFYRSILQNQTHWDTIEHAGLPVSSVATISNENSITCSGYSIQQHEGCLTPDCPRTYEDSVGECEYLPDNTDPTDCPPLYVALETSIDVPPTYENSVVKGHSKNNFCK